VRQTRASIESSGTRATTAIDGSCASQQAAIALVRFNAYSEGWALYAEQLADELGWYAGDPLAQLGYLQSQLRRAARLVVDTGLHALGWSRAQAIAWMVRATGVPEAVMASEVDRYCVKPGQACGYWVGCEEMLRLRAQIERQLGAGHDLRAFNDAVIEAGMLKTNREK
jgi:uncharacterized protein (DUF885 family)